MIEPMSKTSTTWVIACDQNLALPISTQLLEAIATQLLPTTACIVWVSWPFKLINLVYTLTTP